MGNRAVITTRENFNNNGVGIYVHWNGGRDSIEAFLAYCKLKGYRDPAYDCYGWARLCQVIGNFFGGEASVGIDTIDRLDCDNSDNGTYIIKNWEIVGREHPPRREQREYDLLEMLKHIDSCMPESEQLGSYLIAEEVPTAMVCIGDTVVIVDGLTGATSEHKIVGIGEEGKIVNGSNVSGLPYIAKYGGGNMPPENNINNYIQSETARVITFAGVDIK